MTNEAVMITSTDTLSEPGLVGVQYTPLREWGVSVKYDFCAANGQAGKWLHTLPAELAGLRGVEIGSR